MLPGFPDANDLAEPVRYAVRQVGAGWTVYDYRDLEPVRVQGRLQIGLDHATARAVAEALTRAALGIGRLPSPTWPRAA